MGLLLPTLASMQAQTTGLTFSRPTAVAYDGAGDVFVADANRDQVIEISIAGTVTVVAGSGVQGFSGDGGDAAGAELNGPEGVAVGSDGAIYIADTGNQRIRVVRNGQIATFAGTGAAGFGGDGGPALAARLDEPAAIALDPSGALLICDRANERVRRVSGGTIATVAGDGRQGYSGDGGPAAAAELNEPSGVAAGADGRVYIGDTGNARVRVVTTDGRIATFAGSGAPGFGGDGGPAISAALTSPRALAVDNTGALLIADTNNRRLRRVAADRTISTVAGDGLQGAAAEGSLASAAALNEPGGAAVSGFGWPMIADAANQRLSVLLEDGRLYAPAGMTARASQLTGFAPDAVYGAAQATVGVASSPGVPRGQVQVSEAGAQWGQGSLANGAATVPLPRLSAGAHTLTLQYSGDGVHPAAAVGTSITITPAPVTASAAPATVSYGAALPSLSGTLTGVLPQDSADVSAVFSAAAPSMPVVGSYSITAKLVGAASGNYTMAIAAGSGSLTVVPAATVATLAPPPAAYAGLPQQLSARVASTTSGVPTGSIEFLDGSAVIASVPLAGGAASAVYLAPASGQHALSVVYSGDANFLPSTSAMIAAPVSAMPDFGVSVAGNSQQTVLAGSAASYGLKVASQGAPFTGAVTFSASGLPAGAAATFSPTAVVPGTSSAAVTMTVSTAAQTAQRRSETRDLALLIAAAAMLPWLGRRRCVRRMLAGVAVICVILSLNGCGARTVSESALAVQSYTITVKATSTNLAGSVVVHSVDVTLGIQ